jgi:hypothetical protein
MKKIISLLFIFFTLATYSSPEAQNSNDIMLTKLKLAENSTRIDTLEKNYNSVKDLNTLRFNNVSKSILKRSNAIFALCFIIGLFVIIVTLYFNSLLNKNINNINSSLHKSNMKTKKDLEDLKAYIDELIKNLKA